MCDTSGIDLGVVLGQKRKKTLNKVYYTSKSVSGAQQNFAVTEQEILAMVYAFEKLRAYFLCTTVIVHTDNVTLRYLMEKENFKLRLIKWVLLFLEFDFEVKYKRGYEN